MEGWLICLGGSADQACCYLVPCPVSRQWLSTDKHVHQFHRLTNKGPLVTNEVRSRPAVTDHSTELISTLFTRLDYNSLAETTQSINQD